MKRMMGIWVSIFFSVMCYASPHQTLTFRQISTQNGLSQNTVRAILSDRQGFIWAGTINGLNRYDGKNFLTYRPQPGNPSTLSDHRIKELYEDRDGYIWVRMYNNYFTCYDPETEHFIDVYNGEAAIPLFFTHFYESKAGEVWLWGRHGCVRINKNNPDRFTTDFLSVPKNTSLSHPDVYFLSEDSNGDIWVGCRQGVNRISAADLSVTSYFTEPDAPLFRGAIECNGKLYLITNSKWLYIYDFKNARFEAPIATPIDNLFNAALLDQDRILLIAPKDDIALFRISTGTFEKNTMPEWPSENRGNYLTLDNKGGVWLSNHTGYIWYCNPPSGSPRKLALIPSNIVSVIDEERYLVFIDSEGTYWITTYGNGLFRYDPKADQLDNYRYESGKNSLASDYLLSITEDYAGNIWIGSEYAGMVRISKQNYQVSVIRPELEVSIGKNNNVKVVFEDSKENVWVGTKNGSLYRYDKNLNNGRCIHKNLNPYTITEDSKGRIWIGTKGNGVVILDAAQGNVLAHMRHHPANNTTLSHNSVFHLMEDRQGRMWVGTFGGGLNLAKESAKGFTFTRFFSDQQTNKCYIRHIFQDRDNRIWTGSYDGIIRFDPDEFIADSTQYQIFEFNTENSNGLNCNDIKTILQDSSGEIWIGTAGGGINRYVESEEGEVSFIYYTSREGLPGNIVTAILESPDNTLWISTESGMAQFDPKRGSFLIHRFSENTYGNFFNENACFLRKNGDMLWGTLDGMIGFNPELFTKSNHTPAVTFTDLYLQDLRMQSGDPDSPLERAIGYTPAITLRHTQNTFTLGFASLNLTAPELNKYTYILEPYDKAWSPANNTNQATYKNLPPGQYTFRVMGSNANGEWNTEASQLEITVRPPFWKSTVAYLLYILLIIGILYLCIRVVYKFNMLHNAVIMEKQLTDYKLHFFTNISHEFRTPLTLISGATENLVDEQQGFTQNVQKQIRILDQNTRQMTRLIDELLEFRKIQNSSLSLNLERIDVEKMSWEIYTAFRETALKKQIDYRFNCHLEEPKLFLDQEKVEKVIFNLLSNAFKFTPNGGSIELQITEDHRKKCWKISIKDSGCGIPKEKQHLLFSRFMQINFSASGTGVGLSLVKEMVEIHKGRIWYEDNQGGEGSVFNVELPASVEAFSGENFIVRSESDPREQHILADDQVRLELPQVEASVLTSWRVLIIDDNPDILDFLYGELSKHFQVDTASNGKIGLEKAIESNPNLIICDIMMPEMDGFEMTRLLKEEFQTCHIPVILLSAHSSLEHQIEGSESGADFYITKPFSLKFLLSKIYKLIEQQDRLKKRYSLGIPDEENSLSTNNKDQEFYDLIHKILDENLNNPEFSVDEFTALSGFRRTIFYKKVKGLTGFTPNDLIKIKRMKRAAELLATGKHTVSEVSWQVGIEDPFYFSKCFKAQFGCSPSKYKASA